jgi:hypothetical protein
MGTSHVLFGLFRKYQSLLGSLKASEAVTARIKGELVILETTIRMFDVKADVKALAPRRRQSGSRIPKGQCSRMALEVLRAAVGPMTTREIVYRIMEGRGIPASDYKAARAFSSTVHNSLDRYPDSRVRRLPGSPCRWEITR